MPKPNLALAPLLRLYADALRDEPKLVIDQGRGAEVTELRCDTCHLAYPVEGGVPVLLVDLARRTDG